MIRITIFGAYPKTSPVKIKRNSLYRTQGYGWTKTKKTLMTACLSPRAKARKPSDKSDK
jgi:hypothetical protein